MMDDNSVDALIVGGGPAGATAGILLADAGWNVALVERKRFPRGKVCGEYLSATNLPLLRRLGLEQAFAEDAGPPTTHVGLFQGEQVVRADLPQVGARTWGRALGREHLDTLLLAQAGRAGVRVLQPCTPVAVERGLSGFRCRIRFLETDAEEEIAAPLLIAAHGSWEAGVLPTQYWDKAQRRDDLFGFKAHFRETRLPVGLMPLLAFPDGYGGMVHSDGERVSLSCCIRRDRLARLRRMPGESLGQAVLAHIQDSCRGVRDALDGATRAGDWLGSGPLRTGMRLHAPRGIFRVGNALGEAHPVVAEGISMAMQGAWLLSELLTRWRSEGSANDRLDDVARAYHRRWRRAFAPRLRAAALIAHWAMRPAAVNLCMPLVRHFPQLLSWGARLSGKKRLVVR